MASPFTPEGLQELASIISTNAKIIDEYLKSHNLPDLSFAVDGPSDFPVPMRPDVEHVHVARQALLTASKQIYDLTTGPQDSMRWMVWHYNDILVLNVITHFKIGEVVPIKGTISFEGIAKATGIDLHRVRQILRLAMTDRIFCEPQPGQIGHTAASRLIAENTEVQDWLAYNLKDLAPTANKVNDALEKWPTSEETNETAFQLANNTDLTLFAELAKEPARAKRFGAAMSAFANGPGYTLNFLIDGYAWDKLEEGATVVDIGGGNGFVSIALAKAYPKLKFIVEDLPGQISQGEKTLPEGVKSQVKFLEHDFFTEQSVKDADVYLFRWVLHNWSDKYAIQILKNLVPALKDGAKVIINDICLPIPGTANPRDERRYRAMDVVMMLFLNALERDEDDWSDLFARADPRFRFDGVRQPKGCNMHIIEATFLKDIR